MNINIESKTRRAALYLGLVLTVVLILNQGLQFYINATQTFTASMAASDQETIDINIHTDVGRPSNFLSWYLGWQVDSQEVTNSTTSISVSITGSNVGVTAYLDYYVKAVDSTDSETWAKVLEGTDQTVTVGGAPFEASVGKEIAQHLQDIGLTGSEGETIDYYIYVRADAVGAISGENLTTTITETKFDTVSYQYGEEYTVDLVPVSDAHDGMVVDNSGTYGVLWNHDCDQVGGSTTNKVESVIQWPINSIPDSADVTLMKLKYHGYSRNTYMPFTITRCDSVDPYLGLTQPSTYAEPLFLEIEGESEYTGSTDVVVGTNKEWPLNAGACIDLEAALSARDWFAVGLRAIEYVTGSKIQQIYSAGYGSATPKPTLYVEYTAFGASWYNIPPLSVVDLPVTMDVVAVLSVVLTTAFIVQQTRRRNEKWRK